MRGAAAAGGAAAPWRGGRAGAGASGRSLAGGLGGRPRGPGWRRGAVSGAGAMAPSGRERRQRRQGRAVRTEGTGPARAAGSHAARRLRAPPAGSARLPGSPIPRRRRHPARGSAQAGPEAQLREAGAAWSRPCGSCGTREGAGQGGERPVLREAGGERRARAALEERGPGPGGAPSPLPRRARRAGHGGRTSRPTRPSGRRAAARALDRGPRSAFPPQAGSLGRTRLPRGSGGGVGERGGRTSLTMPCCDCRGGGGPAGAQRQERAIGSHRSPPALVPERSVCERSEGDTRTRTPHTRERRERRGGSRSAPRRLRSHARAPGGRGGFLSASSPSRTRSSASPKLRTPVQQRGEPGQARKEGPGRRTGVYPLSLAGGGLNRPCLCPVQPWRPVPSYRVRARAVRHQSWSWGFCKPLPLSSGGAGCREMRSSPLLQVPKLRPGAKWLV